MNVPSPAEKSNQTSTTTNYPSTNQLSSEQLPSRPIDSTAADRTVENAASFGECRADAFDPGAATSQSRRCGNDEPPTSSTDGGGDAGRWSDAEEHARFLVALRQQPRRHRADADDAMEDATEDATPSWADRVGDDAPSNASAPPEGGRKTAATGAAGEASSANEGRWSAEEHSRFLDAFWEHPRRWTKIAERIGTRTKVQVRTHALKYQMKLSREAKKKNKEGADNRGTSRQVVGKVEEVPPAPGADINVYQMVGIGEAEASDSGGKVRKGRWTPEEHSLFLSVVNEFGTNWQRIAAWVKTRSAEQVRTHAQKWHQKLDKAKPSGNDNGINQNENEDKAERSSDESKQTKGPLAQIVASEENRTGEEEEAVAGASRSVEDAGGAHDADGGRAFEALGPARGRWTPAEHLRFLRAIREHGPARHGGNWRQVADAVGTRSTTQVRTHAQKWRQKPDHVRQVEMEAGGLIRTNAPPAARSAGGGPAAGGAGIGSAATANPASGGGVAPGRSHDARHICANPPGTSARTEPTAVRGGMPPPATATPASGATVAPGHSYANVPGASARTEPTAVGGMPLPATATPTSGATVAPGPSQAARRGKRRRTDGTAGVPRASGASGSVEFGRANGPDARGGRWSPEEHRLFLAAVKEHGLDWLRIAAAVKTRSAVQVWTHAREHYRKMGEVAAPGRNEARQNESVESVASKAESTAESVGKGPAVTATLPAAARTGIGNAATANPASGATVPPGRIRLMRCGKRRRTDEKVGVPGASGGSGSVDFGRANDPNARSGSWSLEEHRLFLAAVKEHGLDWLRIAAVVKTRSAVQVWNHAREHYRKMDEVTPGCNKARQNKSVESVASKAESTAESVGKGPAVTANPPAAKDESSERRRRFCVANAAVDRPAPPVERHRGRPKPFTPEEHFHFLVAALRHGMDWEKIATFVATRSAAEVRAHARLWYLKKWLQQRRELRAGGGRSAPKDNKTTR